MGRLEFEYLLHVWRAKPQDQSKLSPEYWRAHITKAPAIPQIGAALNSSSDFDNYNRFRVFDVQYNLGPGLAELAIQGRTRVREMSPPEGENGLPLVLA